MTWEKRTGNRTNHGETGMKSQINTTRYEDITFTHDRESERVQIDKEIKIGGEWFQSLEGGDGRGNTIEHNRRKK